MATVTGWNLHVMGVHTALLLLHVVFVQSLIVADVSGRRRLWSVGWLFYAVALLAEPTWWYLPPLLGTLSQVPSMGRSLGRILRPRAVSTGILVQDMLRGGILGGVLWSDKFFLFLGAGRDFDVALVYLCLQPAVVAYCYYFAVTAPRVNTEIALFQTVLKREGMTSLRDRGRTLRRLLDASLIRACVVGVAGVIVVICSMALIAPEQVVLVLKVCLSSTLFTVLTLLCYEIDHIGDSTSALLLSGIHVAVAAALLLRVAGTGAYLPLAGVDLALCALGLLLYRKRWASPEYSFFWGKAMSW
ncbi:putative membrane protein [Actinomyces naeslundii str. Howell 279]|nr:putative membrane protein [Actinomyces naeslundii str. Howell 279]